MSRGLECATVRELVPDYVGGDLTTAKAAAVSQHLRDCVECRRLAGSQLAAHQALVRAGERNLPGVDDAMFASLHRDVMAAIGQQPVAPRTRSLGRAGAVAAAAVLFACGWFATRPVGGLADRSPIQAIGTGYSPSAGPTMLRPLGEDRVLPVGTGFEDAGMGLRGRLSLRTLEDDATFGHELTVLPPAPPTIPAKLATSPAGHGRK